MSSEIKGCPWRGHCGRNLGFCGVMNLPFLLAGRQKYCQNGVEVEEIVFRQVVEQDADGHFIYRVDPNSVLRNIGTQFEDLTNKKE